MKPRIQCVLTQWNPGFIAFRQQADRQGTERAWLFARPQHYRSISRAMTSCWIWLVPS